MKFKPHAKLHYKVRQKILQLLEDKDLEGIFMYLKRIDETRLSLPETSDLFSCNSEKAMFYNHCVEIYNRTDYPNQFSKEMLGK